MGTPQRFTDWSAVFILSHPSVFRPQLVVVVVVVVVYSTLHFS